jgi:4-hydroxybenzoate polyprenyltransferase
MCVIEPPSAGWYKKIEEATNPGGAACFSLGEFPYCPQNRIEQMAKSSSISPRAIIQLIRPKQWVKNLFVFAPLVFAKDLFIADFVVASLRAFAAFCLTASAIYIINDLQDVDADRAHPKKKSRPIAAGVISPAQALIICALLLIVDVALVWGMRKHFHVLLSAYFLINLAYTYKLKEIFLLDVFIVAAGFMLRVLSGAYAIGVAVSSWLVLCSLFISLFLGFAKRRGELVLQQTSGSMLERKVLQSYTVDLIDQMLTITAAATVISYAMYTVAPRTMEVFGTEKLIYSTLFVIYGVFRYMYLIRTTDSVENPANVVTSDLPIIFTTVLWIVCCILLIYFRSAIPFLEH